MGTFFGWLSPFKLFATVVVLSIVGPIVGRLWRGGPPQPLSRPKAPGRFIIVLFGLCFGGFGLVFMTRIALIPGYHMLQAKQWPTTTGRVVASRVVQEKGPHGDRPRLDVQYRYAVAGRDYVGTGYAVKDDTPIADDELPGIAARFKPGQTVTVHYRPADPADAVLNTDLPRDLLLRVPFCMIFVVVGFGIAAAGVWLPKVARQPSTAAPAAERTAVTLSARGRRVFAAVAFGLFALCWTGMTVAMVVKGYAVFGRMIYAFAVVDVMVVAGVAYQLLGLLNPLVTVTFARLPLRPGDRVRVDYRTSGPFQNVRSFAFHLEGRERATYSVGTSASTAESVAWSIPLTETQRPADVESGHFFVDLPAEAMPTFRARNNTFTWHLCCRGEIPRRPDIKDDFDVPVVNAAAFAAANSAGKSP